jgi:nitrite reductase/ring-hydroxylating ferredoxin subunit
MARAARLICASAALPDSGPGVRFEVAYSGGTAPAFAIRFEGRVYGYLNRCAHVAMELDWRAGEFFDAAGRDLICSTHGAVYAADSGKCLGGPCRGSPLVRLRLEERDGAIYYLGIHHG